MTKQTISRDAHNAMCPAELLDKASPQGMQACCMLDKFMGAMEIIYDLRTCTKYYATEVKDVGRLVGAVLLAARACLTPCCALLVTVAMGHDMLHGILESGDSPRCFTTEGERLIGEIPQCCNVYKYDACQAMFGAGGLSPKLKHLQEKMAACEKSSGHPKHCKPAMKLATELAVKLTRWVSCSSTTKLRRAGSHICFVRRASTHMYKDLGFLETRGSGQVSESSTRLHVKTGIEYSHLLMVDPEAVAHRIDFAKSVQTLPKALTETHQFRPAVVGKLLSLCYTTDWDICNSQIVRYLDDQIGHNPCFVTKTCEKLSVEPYLFSGTPAPTLTPTPHPTALPTPGLTGDWFGNVAQCRKGKFAMKESVSGGTGVEQVWCVQFQFH